MISVKQLKDLLNKIPDDARVYAYEGEKTGIVIVSKENRSKNWFIGAGGWDGVDETPYTEGFENG